VSAIRKTIDRHLPEAESFLCDIMRFPSTPGLEHDLMLYLNQAFGGLDLSTEQVALSDDLKSDPDYSTPIEGISYDGRFNLRLVRTGSGGGRTLLLNAHTDVVPPSQEMTDPWNPRVADGVVYGRGACDDKGQVAVAYLAMRALDTLGLKLKGDVVTHLVVEEENGGNGTLASRPTAGSTPRSAARSGSTSRSPAGPVTVANPG
jgi:acetylornithine deacetylase